MAYMGFNALKAKIAAKGGVSDPGAVAASIGRKKYGAKPFQHAANTRTSLKGHPTVAQQVVKKHKAAKGSTRPAAVLPESPAQEAAENPATAKGNRPAFGSPAWKAMYAKKKVAPGQASTPAA